jgi:hypothetical protein
MPRYVETTETLRANVSITNPSPEALSYQVMVALCTAGTKTVVAQSQAVTITSLTPGATVVVNPTLNAPAIGNYDSYVLVVYLSGLDQKWHVATADVAFEGITVYVPGVVVVAATWA